MTSGDECKYSFNLLLIPSYAYINKLYVFESAMFLCLRSKCATLRHALSTLASNNFSGITPFGSKIIPNENVTLTERHYSRLQGRLHAGESAINPLVKNRREKEKVKYDPFETEL